MGSKMSALAVGLGCLGGLVLLGAAAADDEIDSVFVRTWESASTAARFPPELSDPRVAVPWLRDRPSFGIAFSGGGTRSATATLGQLRALHALGWIEPARYLAANSGGTWTAVPYTYLPAAIDDATFLGPFVAPGSIDDRALRPSDEDEDPHAMATVIHHASTGKRIKRALVQGDEAYADLVGQIFLDPFGLHDTTRFFTFHAQALRSILEANPSLGPDRFYTVEHAERPFLLMVGTLLGKRKKAEPDERFLFEMTPLYVGVRGRFEGRRRGRSFAVGGGYIEPFGYDSREPERPAANGVTEVSLSGRLRDFDKPGSDRYRFTLSDAIGISSAAPSVRLASKGFPTKSFPELRHWAIGHGADPPRRQVELPHGDGGDIDNLAVLPLLARRVESLLVFINTSKPFTAGDASCQSLSDANLVDDLVSFFVPVGALAHNVVFEGGQAALEPICHTFVAQRAEGKPLVHCQRYRVRANPRQGVTPYEPSVCWVYLDRTDRWIDQLDPAGGELTAALKQGDRPFDNFPHYKTFLEQGGTLIDLDRERVNALANLTAWSVLESAEAIRAGLPGAGLPPAD